MPDYQVVLTMEGQTPPGVLSDDHKAISAVFGGPSVSKSATQDGHTAYAVIVDAPSLLAAARDAAARLQALEEDDFVIFLSFTVEPGGDEGS